ncbi:MAG: ABC-type transport auxiliary lipoprotein family protein [Rhodocyclaceae bacterium]|nr:ABC-type transport auxiliary lipoprotein family protein [Rhodocyclaceae bacterium]
MRLAVLCAVLLLAACGGNVRAPRATYDLGTAAVVWRPAGLKLSGVSAAAPAWLATPAIAYRLLYAGGMRRDVYAESRWAGPPAALIERALNRQTPAPGGGCGLRLDVDELVQVFDTPQSSRILLDVRASLVAPDGNAVLARKAFSLARPAPTADARGGVAAAAAAVQALGGELGAWLDATARAAPPIARRCNAG